MTSVAVVIPSIPPRGEPLADALASVARQTRPADQIIVESDPGHTGAAATRNRALRHVTSAWTAFLDDDDHFKPQHLDRLLATAAETGADLVYPWFSLGDGILDPLDAEGQPFDADRLRRANYIPVTVLVRTELLLRVGGFPEAGAADWPYKDNEDHGCWLRLLNAGATFHHLDERTWFWRHWSGNVSGRGDRW